MPGVEVPMPQPRLAQKRAARVLLVAMAFFILAVVTASPGARAQQGHLIPSRSRPMCAMGYRILSPTAGVDLLPYLTTINSHLVRNFRARKPKATGEESKGVAVIRVRIQKDGSLRDGSVTVFSSSGNQDVDAAALSAVRAAAPFARLPEKYSGAYLEL
jgi:TonB family protein